MTTVDTIVVIGTVALLLLAGIVAILPKRPRSEYQPTQDEGLQAARRVWDKYADTIDHGVPPQNYCPICQPLRQSGAVFRRPTLCPNHMRAFVEGARQRLDNRKSQP